MKLCRAALVLVVLAALGACNLSSASIVEDVVKDLEDFAQGDRSMSDITQEDLIALVDTWKALSKDAKAKLLEVPQNKLLHDFGIKPAERIRNRLGDVVVATAFIHRLDKAYKRFRQAYLGECIEDFGYNIRVPKLSNVTSKLRNYEACTLKDFELLKMEHLAWLARYEDIVNYEDVYTSQEEMKNIWNYLNSNLLTPIYKFVLPQVGIIKDPAVLTKIYYDKLYETLKCRFVDGKPTRVD